jgi:hypothetical protein
MDRKWSCKELQEDGGGGGGAPMERAGFHVLAARFSIHLEQGKERRQLQR